MNKEQFYFWSGFIIRLLHQYLIQNMSQYQDFIYLPIFHKSSLPFFIHVFHVPRSKTVSNCWPWLLPPPHVFVLSPWWNSSWELKQPRPCGGCLFLTNTLIGRAGLPLMFQVHDFDSTFTRFGIRHYVSLFVEHTIIMAIFIWFLAVIFLGIFF